MSQLIVLGVMLAVMYALLILPQRRKDRETREMLSALEEGDEVFMTSGIHGFVAALEDQVAWVTVAPGVDLKISRSAIAGVLTVDDGEAGSSSDHGDS